MLKRVTDALAEMDALPIDKCCIADCRVQIHISDGAGDVSARQADGIMEKHGFRFIREKKTGPEGPDTYSAWRMYLGDRMPTKNGTKRKERI